MFLEIKGTHRHPLATGQLYMLGKHIKGIDNESKNFIELEEEDDLNDRHCVIDTSHKGHVMVFDLFSLKGTLLNGKPLNCLEKTRLKNGDTLKLGKQEIQFFHDEHNNSRDSSGFLEVNKNTWDLNSSPDSTSNFANNIERIHNDFVIPATPTNKSSLTPKKNLLLPETECGKSKNFLNTSRASLNSARSDSFTIPETQHCTTKSSLSASDLSMERSNRDDKADQINFNFGHLDSFDDDELCIPETQEVQPVESTSFCQKSSLLSDVQTKTQENNSLEHTNSKTECDNSQFRICTQDYNEGFGEEESVDGSQIIPLIKHQTVLLNNTIEHLDNQHMSPRKRLDAIIDQETTVIRDCITPDLFDFDGIEPLDINKEIYNKNTDDNIELFTGKENNLPSEDEEDLLPTQVLTLPISRKEEAEARKVFNEELCLEKENEEILTLSDKENRVPIGLDAATNLPTQIIEARSHTSLAYRNSATKIKTGVINSKTSISSDSDEEDNSLTEVFILPPIKPSTSTTSCSNNPTMKCFNSTVLHNKTACKSSATLFDEIEKTRMKKISSPKNVFKNPPKDCGTSKKTLTVTSESDLDLLMCTPQLIKEKIVVGETGNMKNNILAAKNKLFGDETEEEDDDQGDLVKLINIPKDTLDFDKLLPHLDRRPQRSKMSEEQKASKEAQKMHKFSLSFGKEQDEKHLINSVSKSSTFERDERHAARNKVKEIAERKERAKTKNKKSKIDRDEDVPSGHKDKEKRKSEQKVNKQIKEQKSHKPMESVATSAKIVENKSIKQDKAKNGRKQSSSTEKNKADVKTTSTSKEIVNNKIKVAQRTPDNSDEIPTQPLGRVTRSRSTSSKNESQDRVASHSSSIKTVSAKNDDRNDTTAKKAGQKRKADTTPKDAVTPAKIERITSKSTQSLDSATSSSSHAVVISTSMVNPEKFQYLIRNSKGLWNVAHNPADSEVLVMDKAYRTFKFLLALAKGIPIVTSEYLRKINDMKSNKGVRIDDYLFVDKEFEKKYKFSLTKSLKVAKTNKLFKGYEFLMTANILPNPNEIKAVIEASGGHVHEKTPPQPKENQKLYLVTTAEDKREWHKYRRLNKNILIVSTEAIMSAIMRQNCEPMSSNSLA